MGNQPANPLIKTIIENDLLIFKSLYTSNPEVGILFQAIRYSRPVFVEYIVTESPGLFNQCFKKILEGRDICVMLQILGYHPFSSSLDVKSDSPYYIDWNAPILKSFTVAERLLKIFIDEYLEHLMYPDNLESKKEKLAKCLEEDLDENGKPTILLSMREVKYLQSEYYDKIFMYIEKFLSYGVKLHRGGWSLSYYSFALLHGATKLLELFEKFNIKGDFKDFERYRFCDHDQLKILISSGNSIESKDKSKNILTVYKYNKKAIHYILDNCDITQHMVDVYIEDIRKNQITGFEEYLPLLERGFVIPGVIHQVIRNRNVYNKTEQIDMFLKYVDINEYYKGYTCILAAAKFADIDVVEHLLNVVPDSSKLLFAKTKSGKNILDVAADIIPGDPLSPSIVPNGPFGEEFYELTKNDVEMKLLTDKKKFRNYFVEDREKIFKLALSHGVKPSECTNEDRRKYLLELSSHLNLK